MEKQKMFHWNISSAALQEGPQNKPALGFMQFTVNGSKFPLFKEIYLRHFSQINHKSEG